MSEIKSIRIQLPETLTIDTVGEIAALLKSSLADNHLGYLLDAQNLERISTPGLQLLISLEKSLRKRGGTMQITASPTLQAACDLCGLSDYWVQWNGVKQHG